MCTRGTGWLGQWYIFSGIEGDGTQINDRLLTAIKSFSPAKFTFSPLFFCFLARWSLLWGGFSLLPDSMFASFLQPCWISAIRAHRFISAFFVNKIKLLSLSAQLERIGLQILTAVCSGGTFVSQSSFKLLTGRGATAGTGGRQTQVQTMQRGRLYNL